MTEKEIEEAVSLFIASSPQDTFRICADLDSLEFLKTAAGYESLNLSQPEVSRRPRILEYLETPAGQGDLFFKLMLKYPSKFGLRGGFLKRYIRAIYSNLWQERNK